VLPSDSSVMISSTSSCEYFEGRPNFDVCMPPNFSAMRYNSNENLGADSSICHPALVTQKSAVVRACTGRWLIPCRVLVCPRRRRIGRRVQPWRVKRRAVRRVHLRLITILQSEGRFLSVPRRFSTPVASRRVSQWLSAFPSRRHWLSSLPGCSAARGAAWSTFLARLRVDFNF
jgi:hypothetical protein